VEELAKLQEKYSVKAQGERSAEGLALTKGGQLMVPKEATDFQLRICIVAHSGAAGHRGIAESKAAVMKVFWWPGIAQDVELFVRDCLLSRVTRGGRVEPMPLGEQPHAEKPNEILHLDFLFMGKSKGEERYILVIKDDATKMVLLRNEVSAGAQEAAEALLEWFSMFGVAPIWITDQGSNFKNELVKEVLHVLGAHHHFTTALCPWDNGSMEVVNRTVLRLFRALLHEWRMPIGEWPRLTRLVQYIMNSMPLIPCEIWHRSR
jgi:transposase InsO family protein